MHSLEAYPDLILDSCPTECNNCKKVYTNKTTGHRIICQCICHHNKRLDEHVKNTIHYNQEPLVIGDKITVNLQLKKPFAGRGDQTTPATTVGDNVPGPVKRRHGR